MKFITFTVQLQADLPQGSQNRNAAALQLCQDINEILAKYDGVTGGAQIYCGKSAEDDAIENIPCGSDQPVSCGACGGKGWLRCIAEGNHPPREEVQRCDACLEFATDPAALEAVVKAAESQPALLKFVEEVALLKHEKEPDDDGILSDRPSEDFIAILNQLILEAGQLLGTADKCDKCGEVVPYVIGCPGGAELCQECFDASQR